MIPQVNIDEEIVKIQTLTIGGRRMTKSVFNQIVETNPFDSRLNFSFDRIVGFVNDPKCRWLLLIKNGQIRKYSLSPLGQLSGIYEFSRISDFKNIKRALGLEIYEMEETYERDYGTNYAKDFYSPEDWNRILELVEKSKSFFRSIENHQIFIAS